MYCTTFKVESAMALISKLPTFPTDTVSIDQCIANIKRQTMVVVHRKYPNSVPLLRANGFHAPRQFSRTGVAKYLRIPLKRLTKGLAMKRITSDQDRGLEAEEARIEETLQKAMTNVFIGVALSEAEIEVHLLYY